VGTRVRPLIGVTTSEVRVPDMGAPTTPQADPPRTEMVLGMKYCVAVECAGGLPVVMPPLDDDAVAPMLDRLSGLCLSGGPDIDPGTYGGRYHSHLGPTEPNLDRFELAIVRGAVARGMPVLAICRGAQMLNVALGGDLYQHLPEDPGGAIEHRKRKADDPDTAHDVQVEPQTVLAGALHQDGECQVNSFHHQAAHRLGHGLRPVAHAPDGVVEAIELPEREFVVGVQWHAEALIERPEQAALFEAFVAAARRYDAAPPARVRRVA
jgi:putative glutamine amidotransferase